MSLGWQVRQSNAAPLGPMAAAGRHGEQTGADLPIDALPVTVDSTNETDLFLYKASVGPGQERRAGFAAQPFPILCLDARTFNEHPGSACQSHVKRHLLNNARRG